MLPIVVACASDARYALPLAVMLHSLTAHLPKDGSAEVFVLDDGMTNADKERVSRAAGELAHLQWIAAAQLPEGLVTWGRMSVTTYQKIAIADWMPAGVERALWLDCDLLICADVTGLWQTDTRGLLAMAARDERVPVVSAKGGIAGYRDLGLHRNAPYFNAGVMLIDVAAWRREQVATQAFGYLKRYRDRIYYWDQEALNAVLAGRWGEVDGRWNWHPGLHRGAGDASILHFSGNLKPWTYTSPAPHWGLYYQHMDQTAWTGWRPPRTWRGTVTAWYESSWVRRMLYPAEIWAMDLVRAATYTYSQRRGSD